MHLSQGLKLLSGNLVAICALSTAMLYMNTLVEWLSDKNNLGNLPIISMFSDFKKGNFPAPVRARHYDASLFLRLPSRSEGKSRRASFIFDSRHHLSAVGNCFVADLMGKCSLQVYVVKHFNASRSDRAWFWQAAFTCVKRRVDVSAKFCG